MKDERHNLPSASAVERYEACAGSFNLSKGTEEDDIRTDDEREWADTGDRIHAWLEDHDLVDLPAEERELAEKCNRQAVDFLAASFEGAQFIVEKEHRIWLTIVDYRLERWKRGTVRRFSGKADVFAVSEDIGAVLDYKPTRRQALISETNMQLRSLAVLLWIKHGRRLKRIFVTIIQPFVGTPDRVVYEHEDLIRAENELISILRTLEEQDAPLEAGPQCRYCPAAMICPRVRETLEAIGKSEPVSADATMLSALLSLCEIAKPKIDQIEARAKAILKDAGDVPGWTLKPNSPTREIIDPLGAFTALSDAGKIDRDTFLKQCVKVGLGNLEKSIAVRLELTGSEARSVVNGFCADFIRLKPKEPSLTRIENGPQ
jgi:hypothetical protein